MDPNIVITPLALYAETHFRFFPFFPSVFYRNVPEILFDTPARLDPGKSLPLMLIANDTKKYPVHLDACELVITQQNRSSVLKIPDLQQYNLPHPFQNNQQVYLITIDRSHFDYGHLQINAKVTARCGRKTRVILNDNYIGSSHLPFSVFVSDTSFPGSDYCCYGDLHTHSQFSQSHVEFGPPIQVIDTVGFAAGLDFIGITDHSYDLECRMDNYLIQDHELTRWNRYQDEFSSNKSYKTIIVPGEEVSCVNEQGYVVHVGALGIHSYIPGSKDGGRVFSGNGPQRTISQAVTEIRDQGGISFAAHPGAQSGALQRIFLGRGIWSQNDCRTGLDGFQGANSSYRESWHRAKELWIKMLQQNIRLPLLAGNDAHGDFNRYRAVKHPFLSIAEGFGRFMGNLRTGIYGKCLHYNEILDKIRLGSTFITNGPFITISTTENPSDSVVEGSVSDTRNSLYLIVLSSVEFGAVSSCTVYGYPAAAVTEKSVLSITCTDMKYEKIVELPQNAFDGYRYIRAEVTCKINKNNELRYAYTSAVFFD